ncbi:MAG: EamA family transporter, partial [Gemmataceae bacterium]
MIPHGLRPYAWMLAGSAWFTGMALFSGALGREECPWQIVACARSGLATLFAAFIAVLSGARFIVRGNRILWIRSIAGSCSMLTTFYALTHMSASDTLTITNTFPIWVALLSWP